MRHPEYDIAERALPVDVSEPVDDLYVSVRIR